MTNQTEYLKTTLNLNFNEYFKKCIFMILKLIYTFFKGKKKDDVLYIYAATHALTLITYLDN